MNAKLLTRNLRQRRMWCWVRPKDNGQKATKIIAQVYDRWLRYDMEKPVHNSENNHARQ